MTHTIAAVSTHAASFLRSAPFQVEGGVAEAADTAGVEAEAFTSGLRALNDVVRVRKPAWAFLSSSLARVATGLLANPAGRDVLPAAVATRPGRVRGMARVDGKLAISFVHLDAIWNLSFASKFALEGPRSCVRGSPIGFEWTLSMDVPASPRGGGMDRLKCEGEERDARRRWEGSQKRGVIPPPRPSYPYPYVDRMPSPLRVSGSIRSPPSMPFLPPIDTFRPRSRWDRVGGLDGMRFWGVRAISPPQSLCPTPGRG